MRWDGWMNLYKWKIIAKISFVNKKSKIFYMLQQIIRKIRYLLLLYYLLLLLLLYYSLIFKTNFFIFSGIIRIFKILKLSDQNCASCSSRKFENASGMISENDVYVEQTLIFGRGTWFVVDYVLRKFRTSIFIAGTPRISGISSEIIEMSIQEIRSSGFH